MTPANFDALSYEEKLLLIEPDAPKLAQFFNWFGPLKHIKVYAVHNFYTELIFDLTEQKIEAIKAFETVDYLEKYRSFMAKVEIQLRRFNNDNLFR